jgi:hypothetical protein
MRYEKPEFVEIKMDAEIGSYQEDSEPTRECPFVSEAGSTDVAAAAVL